MEAAAGASAGATPPGAVPPVDKSSLKKQLRQLIAAHGPHIDISIGRSKSANAESASNVPVETPETESEAALFELMLHFAASLSKKDYGEALRTGQEVLKYNEPVKKTMEEFIPVLEQLTDLSAASGDVESESDSSASGSNSSLSSDSDSSDDSGGDDGKNARKFFQQLDHLLAVFENIKF